MLAPVDFTPSFASTITVVIPAYQPSAILPTLAKEITDLGCHVLIVDDGSGSAYTDIFSALNSCTLLTHPQNRGKGAALKTAFLYIKQHLPETQIIVTMDADGQHTTEDMQKILCLAYLHPHSLIIGSRILSKDDPLRSRFGNKTTELVFAAAAQNKIHDTQSGLRAFSRDLLDYMLAIDGERYEYEMNVLLYCRCSNIPIIESQIQTIYHDKANSCSHFRTIRDSLRIYGQIAKFACSSFISFLADYGAFILLTLLLPSSFLLLANIGARLISGTINYLLNTKAVFRTHCSMKKTLPEYVALATGILIANSAVLYLLTNYLAITPDIAKILTEIILFIMSFLVQYFIIYPNKKMLKN